MSPRELLLVALGGALGAIARHGISVLCTAYLGERFPWGTLLVNVLGCFLLGWLLHEATFASEAARLAVGTGFLGGFTTFSTFGVQTLQAWDRSPAVALANVGANVALGLSAAGIGIYLAGKLHH